MFDGQLFFYNAYIVQNTDKHSLEIKSVTSIDFVHGRPGCQMFVDEALARAKLVT